MRPKGSQQTLEWRRHRAIELLNEGKSPTEVAEFLGVSRNTVYRWRRRFRRDGRHGIAAKPIPGRPPRLTPSQLDQLFRDLELGAQAFGFPSEHWTQARIASLIQRQFDVDFCPFHVGRILTAHGWGLRQTDDDDTAPSSDD